MNILTRMTDGLFGMMERLTPDAVSFWIRLLLLMGLPTFFCGWTFYRGNRSVLTQALACLFGVLVAVSLPVEQWEMPNRVARLWLITATMVIIAFLPAVLPRLLVPTLGLQNRLRWGLFITVLILIFLNLIIN